MGDGTERHRSAPLRGAELYRVMTHQNKNESKLNITYYNAFLRLNTHFPSNQSLDPVGPSRADSPG